MPKADFNQDFPTRASLRRARQAELEAEQKAKADAKKTVAKPGSPTSLMTSLKAGRPVPIRCRTSRAQRP